uniref:Putative secreted protein n=1 Tax=Ixodes scapularis TaxID=6945 RepID=A0A4D5S0T3_IXOSC
MWLVVFCSFVPWTGASRMGRCVQGQGGVVPALRGDSGALHRLLRRFAKPQPHRLLQRNGADHPGGAGRGRGPLRDPLWRQLQDCLHAGQGDLAAAPDVLPRQRYRQQHRAPAGCAP